MSAMMRAGPMAAISLLVGAGCSSGGAPATSSPVASVDDLGAAITAAFCAWQFRCCTAVEITALEANAYRTEAACAGSGVAVAVRDQLALAGDAVANGLLTLDPAAASACVDAYRRRPCLGPQSGPPAAEPDVSAVVAGCPGLFVGQIPVGLRCDMTAECVSGSRCVASTALGGAAASPPSFGVCEPYRALGESCNDSSDCDPAGGLYCRDLDRTCAAPAAAGEPCGPSPTAPLTMQTIACDAAQGLFCDPTALVCRHLAEAGQPCQAGTAVPACDPDPALALACVGAAVNPPGLCEGPGGAGDACGGTALPGCASSLACLPTQADGIGTCGPAPGVGAPCAGGVCAGSAACDPDTLLCTTPGAAAIGSPCTANADCVSVNCAPSAATTSRCVAPLVTPVCQGNSTTPKTVSRGSK
jgi:hypothetical protein